MVEVVEPKVTIGHLPFFTHFVRQGDALCKDALDSFLRTFHPSLPLSKG